MSTFKKDSNGGWFKPERDGSAFHSASGGPSPPVATTGPSSSETGRGGMVNAGWGVLEARWSADTLTEAFIDQAAVLV
jgi:hypothetical protein